MLALRFLSTLYDLERWDHVIPWTMADEKKQQPDYVTLISNDGFEFKLQRSAACMAGAIKKMLDPSSELHPLLPPSSSSLHSSPSHAQFHLANE